MLAKFKQMPLERQLFISFVSVSSILLLVTMGIMLYVDITRQLRSMDDTIRSSAAYIAQLEAVEDMLEQGYPDPAVSRQLDSLSENVKDLNVIVIYNTSGLLLSHRPPAERRDLRGRGGGAHPGGQRTLYHHRIQHLWISAPGLPRGGK